MLMSVKVRITLWYTFFMVIIMISSLGILVQFSASHIFSGIDKQLQHTVTRSFREISCRNGQLHFDADFHILGLENAIYLSVYDNNGNYLYGDLPSYYNGSSILSMDTLTTEYDFYTNWKIYDYKQDIDGFGPLWVRGITSQTKKEGWLVKLSRIIIFMFPFMLLVISFGGYHIIRHTLLPLDILCETAGKISTGNDLSERTGLKNKNDEVYRLAKAFDHMVERLEMAFHREKQFTSDASHELRTPISVILAQCEYALPEDIVIEEKQEALEAIEKQAKKMSSLVSRLLLLARADNGTQILKKENICLTELLQFVCESFEDMALEKNIHLKLSLPETLPISADEGMLIRFFSNMINNGIKYGNKDGYIKISLWKDSDKIRGLIEDNGIGISEENLPKIWERFFQVEPARSSCEDGSSGLGLSLCKWIIEAHGGEITVESILHKGTVFTFSLPLI